jgi:hypothetical protein
MNVKYGISARPNFAAVNTPPHSRAASSGSPWIREVTRETVRAGLNPALTLTLSLREELHYAFVHT